MAILTRRELEVLTEFAHGMNNRDIAARLGISPRTAEIHRAAVLRKLRARSSAHAVFIAFGLSLLPGSSKSPPPGRPVPRAPG